MGTIGVTERNTYFFFFNGSFKKQEGTGSRNCACSRIHTAGSREGWQVGCARSFASEYDSHNVLCPPVWAGPRVQAAGTVVWTDRQLCWLLRLTCRQKLALWGSCRSANPWHSGDTEEDAGQILYKKPSPHAPLSLGGWTEGSPLSDFMLLCSSQGKATLASHRRKEKSSSK